MAELKDKIAEVATGTVPADTLLLGYTAATDELISFDIDLLPSGGGGGSGDATTLEGQAGAYYRSRTNHTGSQAISTVTGLQAALDAKVGDTGAETIEGVKTFSSSPIVPTPTTALQAATKGYVDQFNLRLLALEFNGDPQTIDFGNFYQHVLDVPLGHCFYDTWVKLGTGAGVGYYDWSAGYGGAHAMLRCPYNGNFRKAAKITGATNASPIVITTAEDHGFSTGAITYIRGVEGNTAANEEAPTITVLSSTTFSIDGSTGNGAYTSGGIAYNTETVTFGADDVPYVGQWAHSATGVDMREWSGGGGIVVMYYDGVPVGKTTFTGVRICPDVAAAEARGFMGGSDHSNFKGRISQYRIFEGDNPHKGIVSYETIQLRAFIPQVGFGDEIAGAGYGGSHWNLIKANLLVDFFQPQQIVTDKSAGFPEGRTHAGRIRGSGNTILVERSTYPSPQFVVDNDVPNCVGGTQPVQPAGKTYAITAAPTNALVSDKFERKNSTYSFDGLGGLGSTENGSLGSLTWQYHASYGATDPKPFGILNEQGVYLFDGVEAFARVAIAQTNLDIRVSRKASDTYGAGHSTGIMFRYVDDSNYCFVCTGGTGYTYDLWARNNQVLHIGQVVAGAVTAWTGNLTACPASWEVLRVLTKSDGTYSVLCDATTVVSGTNAQHAAGTGAGIALHGNAAAYGAGKFGAALRMRYRNFTVFTNP